MADFSNLVVPRTEIAKQVAENIDRVEWTLQDPEWRPTRECLQKLLAAYIAHTAALLGRERR